MVGNMEQRGNLDKLAATFPNNGVPHYLQQGAGLLTNKELLVLHVIASLVPIALPLLCAHLW
jgi:hypothetical protein